MAPPRFLRNSRGRCQGPLQHCTDRVPAPTVRRPASGGPTDEELRLDGAFTVAERVVSRSRRRPGHLAGIMPASLDYHGRARAVFHPRRHGAGHQPGGQGVAEALGAAAALVSVEYRIAPQHPYPVPVEDCYADLVWTVEHARELDIDAARVVVGGGSAGSGLAAVVRLLARDRGGPALAGQMLFYQMLDDRNSSYSARTGAAHGTGRRTRWAGPRCSAPWRAASARAVPVLAFGLGESGLGLGLGGLGLAADSCAATPASWPRTVSSWAADCPATATASSRMSLARVIAAVTGRVSPALAVSPSSSRRRRNASSRRGRRSGRRLRRRAGRSSGAGRRTARPEGRAGLPVPCQNSRMGADLAFSRSLGHSLVLADDAEDLPALDPGGDIDDVAGLAQRGFLL
jgi:acetyl esterase/lipase